MLTTPALPLWYMLTHITPVFIAYPDQL